MRVGKGGGKTKEVRREGGSGLEKTGEEKGKKEEEDRYGHTLGSADLKRVLDCMCT